MQRVRIGLTGLGFVFVVVLLAAVFASRSEEEEPLTANLIERRLSGEDVSTARSAEEGQPKDPLAELGVAPGGSESNSSSNKAGGAVDPPPGR